MPAWFADEMTPSFFHPLDQGRSAVIADLQAPLDIRGGRFFVPRDDGHGLVIEGIAGRGIAANIKPVEGSVFAVLHFGDFLNIGRVCPVF